MRLAEKEHKKYKKGTVPKTKTPKEEKLPEWFNKNIEKKRSKYWRTKSNARFTKGVSIKWKE